MIDKLLLKLLYRTKLIHDGNSAKPQYKGLVHGMHSEDLVTSSLRHQTEANNKGKLTYVAHSPTHEKVCNRLSRQKDWGESIVA